MTKSASTSAGRVPSHAARDVMARQAVCAALALGIVAILARIAMLL